MTYVVVLVVVVEKVVHRSAQVAIGALGNQLAVRMPRASSDAYLKKPGGQLIAWTAGESPELRNVLH